MHQNEKGIEGPGDRKVFHRDDYQPISTVGLQIFATVDLAQLSTDDDFAAGDKDRNPRNYSLNSPSGSRPIPQKDGRKRLPVVAGTAV